MSYGDSTGLGIAPAIIVAGASALIKLAGALFGGPPKPIDATTLAALKRSIDTELKVWADSYDLGLVVHANSIRDGNLTTYANSSDVNLSAYGRAALQAISEYSAAHPPGTAQYPEYIGPYGVPITKATYDDFIARGQGAFVKTRAEMVTALQSDPRNRPAPVSAPTLQQKKAGTTSIFQSGVLSSAMPIFIGGALLFVVAAVTNKRK